MKYRYEHFGGIIASEDPPFLAFVDRDYMKELGCTPSHLWDKEDTGILSAPTEVHFAITNRCNNKCSHCYMDSGGEAENEIDLVHIKKALKALAEFGVFHVALGGGEALLREDLLDIARYAREVGLVPNLTISGSSLTEQLAVKLTLMGQINISIDAPFPHENGYRKNTLFHKADSAIDLLLKAGVPTGINCVVGKDNFTYIPELFAYAKKKGVNEIEFLRFKPAGRGKNLYHKSKTTYKQNMGLIPLLAGLSRKHDIITKIDCSFIPMLCVHRPSLDYLKATATYGCEAGNILLGAKSNGFINGCSFLPSSDISIFELKTRWHDDEYFNQFRRWHKNPPAPCNTCDYLCVCKGGCRAVALFHYGNMNMPDPDCPRVVNYHKKRGTR
ncbi:MAG: radical SAM protein [Spirochaetales bacterium]|nr:radical SAM protein [Spirochaetales bacterium]